MFLNEKRSMTTNHFLGGTVNRIRETLIHEPSNIFLTDGRRMGTTLTDDPLTRLEGNVNLENQLNLSI